MSQRREEDGLQVGVVNLLTLNGYWVVHVPNQGRRSNIAGKVLRAMGLWRGFPDLLVFKPIPRALTPTFSALLCTIELKRPRRTLKRGGLEKAQAPKPEQIECHQALRARGVPVLVCSSLEEVVAGFAEIGAPLNARVMA